MQRSRTKRPVLKPQTGEPLQQEKTKMIELFAAYIKGLEDRNKIYTDLEALKKSIT
jgi:hypothetical protein